MFLSAFTRFKRTQFGSCPPTHKKVMTAVTTVPSPSPAFETTFARFTRSTLQPSAKKLAVGAFILGALAWSGVVWLLPLAALFLIVYGFLNTRRAVFALTFGYYGGAYWPIIPGSHVFFGQQHIGAFGILFWGVAALFAAAVWTAAWWGRRFALCSAAAALLITATPPVGLLCLAWPLTPAGLFFPGLRWIALVLLASTAGLALLPARRRWGTLFALLFVCLTVNVWSLLHPTHLPFNIVAVNTRYGGSSFEETDVSAKLYFQAQDLQLRALAFPRAVVLFPETSLPRWNEFDAQFWSSDFARLAQQGTTMILGTTLPRSPEAAWNALIQEGSESAHHGYLQRVPIPIGMWHPFSAEGFPLALQAPPIMPLRGLQAGVLVCYEELLPWTALQTLSRNPVILLGAANDYWAQHTSVPEIQKATMLAWGRLWGIPVYTATNE